MSLWAHFPVIPTDNDIPGYGGYTQESYWLCPEHAIESYRFNFDVHGDTYTEEDMATVESVIARADAINEELGIVEDASVDPYKPVLEQPPAWAECVGCRS